MTLANDAPLSRYRTMRRIRTFEERVGEFAPGVLGRSGPGAAAGQGGTMYVKSIFTFVNDNGIFHT